MSSAPINTPSREAKVAAPMASDKEPGMPAAIGATGVAHTTSGVKRALEDVVNDDDPGAPPPRAAAPGPKRYEPMEATDEAEQRLLASLSVLEKVRRVIGLYRSGGHPTPTLLSKKAKLAKPDWRERVDAFVSRETDPARVGAKSRFTARAQDALFVAISEHGRSELVLQLGTLLLERELAESAASPVSSGWEDGGLEAESQLFQDLAQLLPGLTGGPLGWGM